jgi:hypothetical protein
MHAVTHRSCAKSGTGGGIENAALLALVVVAMAACSSIGPETVQRDRIDYGTSIGDSWSLDSAQYRQAALRRLSGVLEIAQVSLGYQFSTASGGGSMPQTAQFVHGLRRQRACARSIPIADTDLRLLPATTFSRS